MTSARAATVRTMLGSSGAETATGLSRQDLQRRSTHSAVRFSLTATAVDGMGRVVVCGSDPDDSGFGQSVEVFGAQSQRFAEHRPGV